VTFARPTPAQIAAQREADRAARQASLAVPVLTMRLATYDGSLHAGVAKHVYIRSPKLLAAVRTLPCMHTGRVGATEPAHSNWPQHGKAGRIKADDNRVAALHRDVHRELDQGSAWCAEERQRIWWEAHCRTVRELLARGLWPARVPVPNLEDFWA
jgi:hypothetical protein